ncbi:hypothetical protein FQA39_LY01358 [Lamprigera yunnana]|nr:hypothetical protein FQA39_LY01358 [Lamprigera yunnana]
MDDENNKIEKDTVPPIKKIRLWSAQEFRKKLRTPEKAEAIKEFWQIHNEKHIIEYLDNGGGCAELFEALDHDVPELTLLKLVNVILLEIIAKNRFDSNVHNSCKTFLEIHFTSINKMLGLNSPREKRLIILKLLTSMVTLSNGLAKEILLHVDFNSTVVAMLVKSTGQKDSVRSAFINFLMSYLIGQDYSITSIMLDKKHLLQSIFKGLQFDFSDTVALVMSVLGTYVLKNPRVMKTTKMGIFNTAIIKDIVNLYNWKGPNVLNRDKKVQTDSVNLDDKNVVSTAVHEFLLILCTSHKFGVIFKDPNLGLHKKPVNNLMHTVLNGLERPWEHSYASELVTKICGACPDLARTMWHSLDTFLEPRATNKWFSAIKYAILLVQELQPESISFCIQNLNVEQLAQMIPPLVAPTSILKTIIPENRLYEKPAVKYHCILFLNECAKALYKHFAAAKNYLSARDSGTLQTLLGNYINSHFLSANETLVDWTKQDETPNDIIDHLKVILDLFDLYQHMCPHLLDSLNSIDLIELLDEIEKAPKSTDLIKIRTISLFLNFKPSLFGVKTDIFAFSVPLILRWWHKNNDAEVYNTLAQLLSNLGLFDGFLDEISVWINAFMDLHNIDELPDVFVTILKHTADRLFDYVLEIQKLSTNQKLDDLHYQNILRSLYDTPFNHNSGVQISQGVISPLLLGSLDYINVEQSKLLRTYFNSVIVNLLHLQTSTSLLLKIISKNPSIVSKSVMNYIEEWGNNKSATLTKTKLHLIEKFNVIFLSGDLDMFFVELTDHQPRLQYFRQALFYFTQLSEDVLTDTHLQNLLKVFKWVPVNEACSIIFQHNTLLKRFYPIQDSITNQFLREVIKQSPNCEGVLEPFRAKLMLALQKILQKQRKKSFVDIMKNLRVFGLEHLQCVHLLNDCSEATISDGPFVTFLHDLIVFLLKKYLTNLDLLKSLGDNVIITVCRLLIFLNSHTEHFDVGVCSKTFLTYLENFPHTLAIIPEDLFKSILEQSDFCEENAILARFLLINRSDLLCVFLECMDDVAKKIGLILPLLEAAILINVSEDILHNGYKKFEPLLLKALEKPKKAAEHFERYKNVIVTLVKQFMSHERCLMYVEKVQMFDAAEVFHVYIFVAIFEKALLQQLSEKHFNNMVLSLVYGSNQLFKKRNKVDEDWLKIDSIGEASSYLYSKFVVEQVSYRMICENEAFELYSSFCLKFGISSSVHLLKAFRTLVQMVDLKIDEAKRLLEMTGSHSEFLEIVLGPDSKLKTELFQLILIFCTRWPTLLQKNHVPILLSAYNGTMGSADRIILVIIQLYEKMAHQSGFYEFKPFLWGKAGAAHYSVRQDIQKALWRQPKMIDILQILEEDKVKNTIYNHPLNLTLTNSNNEAISSNENIYNLAFFLPLFGSLLVSENRVAIQTFIKSGCLSLTIVGLSCNNKGIRLASCHVLSRLYYHIEAQHSTKDKTVRLCFIESLCRGLANLKDFKLNNFCSIFWAEMALILVQPMHPMYLLLFRYLTAKHTPDLKGIPELYTFLHISDVNYKKPRSFILNILQNGMRSKADCSVAIFRMTFKLLMELFSSCVSDISTKLSILKVIQRACSFDVGSEILCNKYGLLSWLYDVVKVSGEDEAVLYLVVNILLNASTNAQTIDCNMITLILIKIIDENLVSVLFKKEKGMNSFLELVINIFIVNSSFLTKYRLEKLTSATEDAHSKYLMKYGSKYSLYHKSNLIQSLVIKWWNNKS